MKARIRLTLEITVPAENWTNEDGSSMTAEQFKDALNNTEYEELTENYDCQEVQRDIEVSE
jgi:hypothetical protein